MRELLWGRAGARWAKQGWRITVTCFLSNPLSRRRRRRRHTCKMKRVRLPFAEHELLIMAKGGLTLADSGLGARNFCNTFNSVDTNTCERFSLFRRMRAICYSHACDGDRTRFLIMLRPRSVYRTARCIYNVNYNAVARGPSCRHCGVRAVVRERARFKFPIAGHRCRPILYFTIYAVRSFSGV